MARIFTKSIKVIGLTADELDSMRALVNNYDSLKANLIPTEIEVGPSQFIAIDVSDNYRYRSAMMYKDPDMAMPRPVRKI